MNIFINELEESHCKMKIVLNELLFEYNKHYNENICYVCKNSKNELFTEFIFYRKYKFCSYFCACIEMDAQRKYNSIHIYYNFYPNNKNFY